VCGVRITQVIKLLKNDLMLAFSTASSEAVLPTVMKKIERFGVPRDIASFVLPTGYSFNLDGAAMYQSIAALFVAQLY
ncbi:cation:dicarboxylate symporter family transporter, partial [Staphylococcus aureus]